jgi:hypothetical protein
LAQHGLFDSGPSPEVKNLLIGLEENARAPRRIAEMIDRVVDAVDRLGDPHQGTIFGDAASVPETDRLIVRAIESVRNEFEVKSTGDLFKTPEAEVVKQDMGVKADTPEQSAAIDITVRHPDTMIQTGEIGPDDEPVYIRAADMMKDMAETEQQTKRDTAAFRKAIDCDARYEG